jgi:hypothetical protein
MKLKLPAVLMLALLGTLTSFSSFAEDTRLPLFTATSDAFDDQLEFSITVDENSNTTGLIYTQSGKDIPIPLSSLGDGVVLYQSSGKNVVTLSSASFAAANGGDITLTYLTNGLSNTYKKFVFSVSREGQNWTPSALNSRGIPQAFVSMYLKGKRLLGKIVGIDTITVK